MAKEFIRNVCVLYWPSSRCQSKKSIEISVSIIICCGIGNEQQNYNSIAGPKIMPKRCLWCVRARTSVRECKGGHTKLTGADQFVVCANGHNMQIFVIIPWNLRKFRRNFGLIGIWTRLISLRGIVLHAWSHTHARRALLDDRNAEKRQKHTANELVDSTNIIISIIYTRRVDRQATRLHVRMSAQASGSVQRQQHPPTCCQLV